MSDKQQLTKAEQAHMKEHFPGGVYKVAKTTKTKVAGTAKPAGSWKK